MAADVVYLPDSNLDHPLLVLGVWLAGSLAVLAYVDLLHLAERRDAPEQEAEIYATSGTAHLRRRRARRRAAAVNRGLLTVGRGDPGIAPELIGRAADR
ncbi:MAG: hypothetical protein ABSA53_37090 [Streptosporangiaceae bacterium]